MNERPILTDTLQGFCRTALETIQAEFKRRYPSAVCFVHTTLHRDSFQFEISHLYNSEHWDTRCHIGKGETPEEAFAHLDKQLGPPMSEAERLRRKAEQLMQDAAELEARQVAEEAAQSNQLPVSSPA